MYVQNVLPRWRGFNLPSRTHEWVEEDFRWIADEGFDFVRIPTNYHNWVSPEDPSRVLEEKIESLDRVMAWGETYGVHVDLAFHRAPGYCTVPGPEPGGGEPWSLWKSDVARRVFRDQWAYFARRYRGVPSARLSFNLLNEPPPPWESPLRQDLPMQVMTRAEHEKVMRDTVAAVREIDPDRLLILDGMWYGRGEPTPELADLGVAQSTRGYTPMGLTHWQAPWWREGSMDFPVPVWPGGLEWDRRCWTRDTLEEHYRPWAELAAQGVGVHCGEAGCWNRTPHAVFLAWLEDVLDILTGHGIGWALWNLRGDFGVLDSGRTDVAYVEAGGHRLDRKLLDLLRRH